MTSHLVVPLFYLEAIGDRLVLLLFYLERLPTSLNLLSFLHIFGNKSSVLGSFNPCVTEKTDLFRRLLVRAIGEGVIPAITLPDTSVVIPLQYSIPNDTTAHLQASSHFQHLIDLVYPDLFTADSSSFADRGILAPTNTSTDEINAHILNLLQNTLSPVH
ncbi:unnamed protein product, partial [Scytosiphon promiscuus]